MTALLLGGLTAVALPPFTVVPILLLTIPGLLGLIGAASSWRGAFWRGLLFGIGLHMAGLYWVTNAILVRAGEFWWAVPFAVPLLASVMAIFIAIPCGLARLAAPGWRRATLLAGLWVLGDLARQFVLSGFPWNPLGSAWEMPGTAGLIFMQPAAWVGVHGLTLGTVLLAAGPSLAWRGRILALCAFIVWTVAGYDRLRLPAGRAPGIRAVIVQGNVPEMEHMSHWQDRAWINSIFDRHLALTRKGAAQAAGGRFIVIWPETASPFWLQSDAAARQAVAEASRPAIASLVGAPREGDGQAHNILIVIGQNGQVAATYDKFHLVPYGEYFPSYLPIRLGEQGWAPGTGIRSLHVPGLPAFGPLICYEAIFPAQVVDEADRPALLVNITNDAWFGDSAGPRQHLAAARMRSVEEGLPMLRAANTGISAVIDAHGRVLSRLELDHEAVLSADIPGFLPPTPVARLGLAAPLLLALAACGIGLGFGRRTELGGGLPRNLDDIQKIGGSS